jgi:hypothetical protein
VLTGGKVTVLSVVVQIQNSAFLHRFLYSDVHVDDISDTSLKPILSEAPNISVLSYVTPTLQIEVLVSECDQL